MVVVGHFIQVFLERSGGYPVFESVLCAIYFFHMPLFVFVSGRFSRNLEKRRSRAFEDLLIPYLVVQLIWAAYRFVSDNSLGVLSNIFYPQFAMWYLLALFIWRMLLPDILRIRGILAVSAVLFFAAQACEGIDNSFALQRAIGFLVFFLLGYLVDEDWLCRIRALPIAVCVVLLAAAFGGCYVLFGCLGIGYGGVFMTLAHGMHLSDYSSVFVGLGAYAFMFSAAIVLSACVVRLVPCESRVLGRLGRSTMPIYLTHGFIVYAFCALYCRFVEAHAALDAVALAVAAMLTICLLSTSWYVKGFNFVMGKVKSAVLRSARLNA